LLLAGWLWWEQSDPETTEHATENATEETASPPAPLTLEQPSKAAEQAPSPPPAIRKAPAAAPAPIPANVARDALPPGDLSDDAIAAFSPETIEMLNKHKYWSAQKGALLVGLYETWVDRKEQGVDAEDVRQQIAWALQGVFMEDY
jgi:hypothetical protein